MSIKTIQCLCKCGCGEEISDTYVWRGKVYKRNRTYKHGHYFRVNKYSFPGELNSQYGKKGVLAAAYGIKRSEEFKAAKRAQRHTEEFKDRLSNLRKGEKNPIWKGDDVGNNALHAWVKRNLPKPNICQTDGCMKAPYDLSNITGIYDRNFENWKYYCRSHHMKFDYDSGVRKSKK